ncbi:MAG: hypothetical protein NPIRA02_21040 [Nitrospirales bacterium]|nr:MAG: hypothetical protein NPIRA02_21040 [Nitrospirales bacterium]
MWSEFGGPPCWAEWSSEVESTFYYTDNVVLFSSSRRLSLQEDPTQPVIDVTGQGSDSVFEPDLIIGKTWNNRVGTTSLSVRGQGFIFADQSRFTHGTYGLRLEHTLPSQFTLGLRYHYGPNLFLGDNESRRSEREELVEERITTHFWTGTIEQDLGNTLTLRVLGRYGLRLYNENFAHRDTSFWTVGPHVEWKLWPEIALTVGYHFERGVADGRNEPQFRDDVFYINHYVSTELEVEVCEATSVELAFHYERNDFTSDITGDERKDATEDVFQGDVEIRHMLSNAFEVNAGVQRSQRKTSFESRPSLT